MPTPDNPTVAPHKHTAHTKHQQTVMNAVTLAGTTPPQTRSQKGTMPTTTQVDQNLRRRMRTNNDSGREHSDNTSNQAHSLT